MYPYSMDARKGATTRAGRGPTKPRGVESSPVLFLPIARRNNLPVPTSSLVGREDEIAEIRDTLPLHRLVTLIGPGGVGKTRLALAVAETLTDRYAGGVWLVELGDLTSSEVLPDELYAALPGRTAIGNRLDFACGLAGDHLLLVLDTCDHLRAPCAQFIDDLLQQSPAVSVLATSRERLGVPGELLHRVEPLGLPAPDAPDGAPLAASVLLFAARARAVHPDFRLTPDISPAVEALCRSLDGLPLAIELAAARTAVLSPAEILARLGGDFRLLGNRSALVPARHRSLRACVEWSVGLLSDGEAELFARLAVFRGGFDLATVEAVCTDERIERDTVLDLLESLVAKSLVAAELDRDVTRFRISEVIRAFAQIKLDESGEFDRWAVTHARWCVERAEDVARWGSELPSLLRIELIERDDLNFCAALEWARHHGRADIVVRLGAALGWFWEARGRLAEGAEWLRWGLEADPATDREVRATALRALGILTWLQGDVSTAASLVREATDLFRLAGRDAEAEACVSLGAFHLCANPTESLPALEADLARARSGGDPGRLARSLVNCGNASFFAGNTARSRQRFEAALDLPRATVDAEIVVEAQVGCGRLAVMAGNLAAGERAFTDALELAELIRDDRGLATALTWLGEVWRIRGNLPRARSILADAMEVAIHTGAPLARARCQQFRGRVEVDGGDLTEARELFTASLAPAAAMAMPYHRVRSLQGLADLARVRGNFDEARRLVEDALRLADAHGDVIARASSLITLARLTERDSARALSLACDAFDLQLSSGDAVGMLTTLDAMAELAASSGRPEVAARVVGAAQRARAHGGCVSTVIAAPALLRDHPQVAELLRCGAWASAIDEGRTLSPVAAVALVRGRKWSRVRRTTGWDSLTPVQRRVAELVASSFSNPEIGRQLLISDRTVSAHVTHVYRKLGVANRPELKRVARTQGIREVGSRPAVPPLAIIAGC